MTAATPETTEIVVRYACAAEVARALKRIRRFGLRSPVDHLVVEGARALLVLLPMALVLAGAIGFDHAIAAYGGYFALRWFNAFVKPWLLRRFGPTFPAPEGMAGLVMILGPSGIRSETENGLIRAAWRALPPPRVYDDGLVLRIAPEHSLVVAADHLPDGVTPADLGRRSAGWRGDGATP